MSLHRTAMGRAVDMSSMAAKNEKVRAVGNMSVNARGDVIDSHNRIVKNNSQRVKESYRNTVSTETPDHLTPGTQPTQSALQEDAQITTPELSTEEMKYFDEYDEVEEVKEKVEVKKK